MTKTKFIAVAVIICMTVMMCACQKTEHEHVYSDEWSYDETYHWQEPICGDTTEPGNKSVHNYVRGVCHLCGYSPNADKLPDYYDVKYAVNGEGGKIEGQLNQRVRRGGDAQPVTAVPLDGFLFVMWTDGEINAERQDKNVQKTLEVYAVFEPDPDDPDTDIDDDYGNDHPDENEDDDTVKKGKTEISGGLEFTEIRDLTSDEITGYSVKLASTGNFDGIVPDTYNDFPVLEIDDNGFANCRLEHITLSSNLTRIGHQAFINCGNLASIEIPDTVLDIGNQSFQYCYNLQNIKLSANMKGVWYKMFYRCGNLTEITLPDSVESLGRYAFYGCSKLNKITFGTGIAKCGAKAFGLCNNLAEVHIKDIKAWCETTFDYFMMSLKSTFESNPIYYAKNLYFDDENGNSTLITDLVVPEGTKEITSYAFINCESLKTVTTPTSLRIMGKMVFLDCHNLESIEFEEGLLTMEYSVFSRCYNLKNIKFPDSMTDIGADPDALENVGSVVMESCNSLTELTIGVGLKQIDSCLCSACKQLGDIYYLGTSEQWEQMDRKPNWLSECKPQVTVHCLGDSKDIIYESHWVVEYYTRYPRYEKIGEETCTHGNDR